MDVDSGSPSLPESEISPYIPEPTPVPSSCGSEGGVESQYMDVVSEDGDKVEAPSAAQPDADEEGPVSPQQSVADGSDGNAPDTPMSPHDEPVIASYR